MRIAVIDGQGGGIGKAVIERLRQDFGNELNIVAFGTNALATSLMLKAGANEGATGENAIIVSVGEFDVVIGSISVIAANSMYGELTPGMAAAVSGAHALKILIPLNRNNIRIAGVVNEPLPHYIQEAMSLLRNHMEEKKNV
jgi:hypothetical protein